jgi:3-methyladenine DNA glycosylase AlkC
LQNRLNDVSKENKKILSDIVEAYEGNMDHFLSLLEYNFKETNKSKKKEITKS